MRIAGLRIRPWGRRVRLGEAVPHGDDWWISTDDARDYAAWLDRRVNETDALFTAAIAKLGLQSWDMTLPVPQGAGPFLTLYAEYLSWSGKWRAFYASVEDSWFARVNSWETIKARHAELVELRNRLKNLNVVPVPSIAPPPTDPGEKAGDKLTTYFGIAVVVAVGIVAWRSTK